MPNTDDDWEIWVRDEDRLDEATSLLQEFNLNPTDPKYAAAVKEANLAIQEKQKQRREASQNVREVRYRSAAVGDRRIPPITLTLIILCCFVSVLNNFGTPDTSNEIGNAINRQMYFVNSLDFAKSDGDKLINIKQGQLWRTITPIFLHGSALHLAMNVIGMIVLGRICERWLGSNRYALLILISAVLPNLLQALAPAELRGSPFFGGISGVVYALFGLVWIRSTLNPMHGFFIPFPYLVMMLIPIGIGFSGLIPKWNQADLCHLGGLLIGIAVAYFIERS